MSLFQFQRFSVLQKHSAMKVCTDATLFGAMAPIKGGERVLDIGTGTGLLSLIVAQLGAGQVTAVELTSEAYDEASINFRNSPWKDCLNAVHGDIQHFSESTKDRFDLIISNPPFFDNHSKTPTTLRQIARHTDQLSYSALIKITGRLLKQDGQFYLLIPVHAVERIMKEACKAGLFLIKRFDYRGFSRNQAKVSTLLFSRKASVLKEKVLTIYRSEQVYSEESEQYLKPFLLRF